VETELKKEANMTQDKQPKAPLSERIAALRGKVTPAREVSRAINEAQKTAATKEDVKVFFEGVAKGDSIAIFHLSRKIPRKEAVQQWLAFSWPEWLTRLQIYASSGDSIAQEAVEIYQTFASNPLLLSQLQEVLERFERPCRAIHTKEEAISFLEKLADEGLWEAYQENPKKRKAIHWGKTWYLPKRGISIAYLGWPFALRATIRAQRRETAERRLIERLSPLFDLATIESDPEDLGLNRILNGEFQTVVIWEEHLKWGGEDKGLLAIALGRRNHGLTLFIEGYLADFPIPIETPYELPDLFTEEKEGKLWVRFGRIPRLEREEYQTVQMSEHLIQIRLNEENKTTAQLELAVEPIT